MVPHACAQENNFKAVLECIRDLMNERTVLPEWLHDIFLGYGDPAAAQYTNLPNTLRTVDFKVALCSPILYVRACISELCLPPANTFPSWVHQVMSA